MGSRRVDRNRNAPSPLPDKIGGLLQESRWLGLGAIALFLGMALWGFSKDDPGWSHTVMSNTIHNPAGRAGAWISDLMLYIFGFSAWWWIVLLGMFVWWGVRHINAQEGEARHPLYIALLGFFFLLLASSSLEALRFYSASLELPLSPGGMLGLEMSRMLESQLGFTGSTLLLLACVAVGWSAFSGMSWLWAFERLGAGLETFVGFFYGRVDTWRDRQIGKEVAQQREVVVEEEKRRVELHEPIIIETPAPVEVPVSKKAEARLEREKQVALFPEAIIGGQLPPLHLLDPAPPPTETVSPETLEYTSRLIERKLADFGVQVKVLAAMPGPVITRYEIEPAVGVKGAQIVNLARDLARALAMVSIRVVETVPGKSCMALELPNPKRQTVKLSEIISSKPYNDMSSPLTVCLGKDIGGLPVVADLAKTPHLLVAGTTGSGKSVGVNAMILSMLYKAEPDQVRLIMVDPKMLELSIYEGIPHLLAPVVTDMKQAANALHWCVTEMEKRYKLMSAMGVRNIAGLNTKIKDAEKARRTHSEPADADAGNPGAAADHAVHRRHHRRTGRPDDGRRQEGRRADCPSRPKGARFRHPPRAGDAASFGRCDYRPDQGQYPDPLVVPGVEQDRLAHHSRPDGRRSAARSGRHAVPRTRHRLPDPRPWRFCFR